MVAGRKRRLKKRARCQSAPPFVLEADTEKPQRAECALTVSPQVSWPGVWRPADSAAGPQPRRKRCQRLGPRPRQERPPRPARGLPAPAAACAVGPGQSRAARDPDLGTYPSLTWGAREVTRREDGACRLEPEQRRSPLPSHPPWWPRYIPSFRGVVGPRVTVTGPEPSARKHKSIEGHSSGCGEEQAEWDRVKRSSHRVWRICRWAMMGREEPRLQALLPSIQEVGYRKIFFKVRKARASLNAGGKEGGRREGEVVDPGEKGPMVRESGWRELQAKGKF